MIKIEDYREHQISYNQQAKPEEAFEVEINGRFRKFASLTEVITTIDKFVDSKPKEKKKPFEKFKAIRFHGTFHGTYAEHRDMFEDVTVTSYAGASGYRDSDRHEFWIINSSGRREKIAASELIQVTAENEAKVKAIKTYNSEAQGFRERARKLGVELKRVDVPKDEEK